MSKAQQCPVCKVEAQILDNSGGSWKIICPRCGNFSIGWQARPPNEYFDTTQIANLSGWIREHQNYVLSVSDMAGLRALRTPTVGEKAEKILSYFAHKYPKPGELIDFHENIVSPEMLSIGWAIDHRELDFLILSYLYLEKEFFTLVEIETERMIGSKKEQFRMISPKGWAYLDSLRQGNLQSQIGFIAMWFDESMNEARLAIEKGIRVAGYEPLRIDQKQHNNKIDDEIVAAIRQSKFVVADFTKQRGGVYFEAGFARGLDLEVIWLCRQDELKEVHFDTRQYNFIVWETDKLPELSKNLQNRIEATIGRGTLQ